MTGDNWWLVRYHCGDHVDACFLRSDDATGVLKRISPYIRGFCYYSSLADDSWHWYRSAGKWRSGGENWPPFPLSFLQLSTCPCQHSTVEMIEFLLNLTLLQEGIIAVISITLFLVLANRLTTWEYIVPKEVQWIDRPQERFGYLRAKARSFFVMKKNIMQAYLEVTCF